MLKIPNQEKTDKEKVFHNKAGKSKLEVTNHAKEEQKIYNILWKEQNQKGYDPIPILREWYENM